MEIAVSYIDDQRRLHEKIPVHDAARLDFVGYHSIRTIPAYKGSKHLPGYYWFSSLNELVPYESRLEMFTLMGFDFEQSVIGVLSQPLLFHFQRDGDAYSHVPDYLVWRRDGSAAIVDVKRISQVGTVRNRKSFSSTEVACQRLGWGYEVRTEPDDAYLANLKWLAGFRRRPPHFETSAAGFIEECAEQSVPIRQLLAQSDYPVLARPILFHLLWQGLLRVDMVSVLHEESLVYLATSERAI